MHGLELHRSWGRLAALVKALNGQRLLREGPKNWRHCGRAQPGHALRAGSAGPFIIRPHPQAVRLCDVVRTSCAWLGWTAQVELGLLVLVEARRGSVVGTSLSASVWMLLDRARAEDRVVTQKLDRFAQRMAAGVGDAPL